MSRLSTIRNLMGLSLNKPINPLTAILGGQMVVAPIAKGIREDLTADPAAEVDRQRKALQKRMTSQMLARSIAANRDRTTMMNLQYLQRNAPEVYDSVVAGRRLPQDAVVLGGQRREDLLQELARNMGSSQGSPSQLPF
jgi:hypothetical protein